MGRFSTCGGYSLAIRLFGEKFSNPVFLASGVFGYGLDFPEVVEQAGAIFTKGISIKPRAGNPPPRIVEVTGGIVNSIGLENIGIEAFLKRVLPKLKKIKAKVFVNIAGNTIEEYCQLARALGDEVNGIELNISCPNVRNGLIFGQDPRMTRRVVTKVRRATKLPLVVKLTPNFCNIVDVARAAQDSGADGISLINTVHGMVFDIDRKRPLITGGLSGPAIKPFALYCVYRIKDAVRLPIIAIGGIMTGSDAYEFILAGAKAVALGSVCIVNPYAPLKIIRELDELMKRK